MRTIYCKRLIALFGAATLLLTGCSGGTPSAIPNGNTLMQSRSAPLSIDAAGKCRFGKIHVYNGPSGGGGAVQVISDQRGNIWYGSIGVNAIVKYVRKKGGIAYTIPSANAKPEGIAEDPHGRMWFTEWNLSQIGSVSSRGSVAEYPIAQFNGAQSRAVDMVLGPDKRLWFTTDAMGIGARSKNGSVVLYSIANNAEQPTKLTVGPDRNLWFTEYNGPNVGRITRSGHVTEFNVNGGANNFGIAAGPDGRIWFTDSANHRIGAMKTNGTGLIYYSVGTGSPAEIALRREDGKLYFTEWEGYIGQITRTGSVRLCAIPANPKFVAFGITENRVDHSMWFVDNSTSGLDRLGELVVK